jgi:hypothetical protein
LIENLPHGVSELTHLWLTRCICRFRSALTQWSDSFADVALNMSWHGRSSDPPWIGVNGRVRVAAVRMFTALQVPSIVHQGREQFDCLPAAILTATKMTRLRVRCVIRVVIHPGELEAWARQARRRWTALQIRRDCLAAVLISDHGSCSNTLRSAMRRAFGVPPAPSTPGEQRRRSRRSYSRSKRS